MTEETKRYETWQFWVWLAICGMIGAFVALNLMPTELCWAGFLVGGVLGYFAYDIREVATKTKVVLREFLTLDNLGRVLAWTGLGLAQAPALIGYCLLETGIWLVRALIYWGIVGVVVSTYLHATYLWFEVTDKAGQDPFILSVGVLTVVVTVFTFVGNVVYAGEEGTHFSRKWLVCNGLLTIFGVAFIFAMPYVAVAVICVAGAAIGVAICRVTKKILLAIHSEARLVYALSALVGSATGYLFGYSILGGLGALACGWLEYQLVRPRLLARGLIPSTVE